MKRYDETRLRYQRYDLMSNTQLKRLLKDGDRHWRLVDEAKMRGITVKRRLVDKMRLYELVGWTIVLAAMAKRNVMARKLLELERESPERFMQALDDLLVCGKVRGGRFSLVAVKRARHLARELDIDPAQ